LALMPLSAAEAVGSPSRWFKDVLAGGEPSPVHVTATRADAFDAVVAGGYPAALIRPTINQRSRWFSSYLSTVTDRDVPELVDTRRPGVLSRLYRILSQRTSSVIVNTELAPTLDVTPATVASYREILARLYLTIELPGWTVGVSAKPSHRPKVHVTDTGLATGVLSLSALQLATSAQGGAFVESFVLNELMRQAASIDEPLTFAHFRDRSGIEVDIIIERHDGTAIAVEVKSAIAVHRKDAAGLLFLRDRLGDRFQCGIVFHSGSVTARLDDQIWAVPLSSLWGGQSFAPAS